MAISYNKLWKLLIDKNIKKTDLRRVAGISTNVIAKLGRNDPVSMESLAKICAALNCDIADIVVMTAESNKEETNG
jgi:DNA (cytosine-5)-methyltransferase 1